MPILADEAVAPKSSDLALAGGAEGGGEGKGDSLLPEPRAEAGEAASGVKAPARRGLALAPDGWSLALDGDGGREKSGEMLSGWSRLNLICGVSRLCLTHNQCSKIISGSKVGHRWCNSVRSCSK